MRSYQRMCSLHQGRGASSPAWTHSGLWSHIPWHDVQPSGGTHLYLCRGKHTQKSNSHKWNNRLVNQRPTESLFLYFLLLLTQNKLKIFFSPSGINLCSSSWLYLTKYSQILWVFQVSTNYCFSNSHYHQVDLGCVHAYFAKAESAFWNADSKRPSREYCSCFPREEDDFVSMHCALFEAIVRAQVNRKGVYMTSFKRGYMWFCVHASTRISVLL